MQIYLQGSLNNSYLNYSDYLPDSLWQKIFSFLPPTSSALYPLLLSSRRFHKIASQNRLWKRIYFATFERPITGRGAVKERYYKELLESQLQTTVKGIEKLLFFEKGRSFFDLKNIICTIELDKTTLLIDSFLVGVDDKDLFLFDLNQCQKKITPLQIRVHENGIQKIRQISNTELVTFSNPSFERRKFEPREIEIKIWDFEKKEFPSSSFKIKDIDWVYGPFLSQALFILKKKESKFKIFDVKTFKIIEEFYVFRLKEEIWHPINLNEKEIVFGDYDNKKRLIINRQTKKRTICEWPSHVSNDSNEHFLGKNRERILSYVFSIETLKKFARLKDTKTQQIIYEGQWVDRIIVDGNRICEISKPLISGGLDKIQLYDWTKVNSNKNLF